MNSIGDDIFDNNETLYNRINNFIYDIERIFISTPLPLDSLVLSAIDTIDKIPIKGIDHLIQETRNEIASIPPFVLFRSLTNSNDGANDDDDDAQQLFTSLCNEIMYNFINSIIIGIKRMFMTAPFPLDHLASTIPNDINNTKISIVEINNTTIKNHPTIPVRYADALLNFTTAFISCPSSFFPTYCT